MSRTLGRIALVTALLYVLVHGEAVAQEKVSGDYASWLEEVSYIISDAERDYLFSLRAERERERFVEAFWALRDPTPETERNEYRDEYYLRLSRARREYDIYNKLGLKAIMGQIYLLLGEPLKELTFSDPALNGPIYAWYYPPDKSCGLKYYFFVVFFKPSGKVYRIYNPTTYDPADLFAAQGGERSSDSRDEEALNRLLHIDPLLGQLSLSLLPREHSPIMMDNKAELRRALSRRTSASKKVMQMLLDSRNFRQEEILVKLKSIVSEKAGMERGDSWILAQFTGTYRFDTFRDDNGMQRVYFCFAVDSEQIAMNEYRGKCYSVLWVSSVAVNEDGGVAGRLEDKVTATFEHEERGRSGAFSLAYVGVMSLAQGSYQVTVTIRNPVDRRFFEFSEQMEVPRPLVRTMMFSPIMLVHSSSKSGSPEGDSAPYQFGGVRYLPNVTGAVAVGRDSEVYYQLYFTQRQRVNDVTVRYELISRGRVLWQSNERLDREMMLPGGAISRAATIGTAGLPAGHYTLQITAASVSPPIARAAIEFEIVADWHLPAVPKLAEKVK